VDTGNNIITNTGVMEATGTGGLMIHGDVANSGVLWANGGNVTVAGNVTGAGHAVIDGNAMLEFTAASNQDMTFSAGATGTLKLDQSSAYTGTVAGFGQGDQLVLADIASRPDTTVAFTQNQTGSGGTLTVSDGAHTANIGLEGQYSAQGFHLTVDTGTGTLISYSPIAQPTDHIV